MYLYYDEERKVKHTTDKEKEYNKVTDPESDVMIYPYHSQKWNKG